MIPEQIEKKAIQRIGEYTGMPTKFVSFRYTSGGCINSTGVIETEAGHFFIKWNLKNAFPGMFEAEFKGLELLLKSETVRIPKPLFTEEAYTYSFLLTEYITSGPRSGNYWEQLGQQLATMHQHTTNHFGLDHNNYIGSLPQVNNFANNWIDFFINQRLEVQLKRALDSGKLTQAIRNAFYRLFISLPSILPENEPAALIHGDLWSGNLMTGPGGEPVIIDPAVYYGNREIEIAFTTLFGGFDTVFYTAYEQTRPLAPGFFERQEIYNLYPLLVHVNLFGGGYISQVERIVSRF